MLAFKNEGDVELLSRNRLPQHVPAVAKAIAALPVQNIILDGEATWNGRGEYPYNVFDILWLNGQSVTSLPLDTRRALLGELPLRAPIGRVTAIEHPKPWELACAEGWEGVIAKRRDAPYEHRRSRAWLKMKCEAAQAFVVGGFTDPQGARVGLGALLVGYFDGNELVYAGKVGTGFDTKLLLELRARLDAAEIQNSPFTKAVGLPRVRSHWVRPEIVVQVAFIEWTVNGKLRHARLLGLRNDRSPHEVVKETA
jgi:bifunctional non-homologous end joining protein LigD